MRARTITIISLLVCAFAIPASASADPASSDYSRADAIAGGLEESTQSTSGSDYSSVNATTPPSSEPVQVGHGDAPPVDPYSSPNAISGPLTEQPTFASGSPSSNDGFDWASAAIGAGAAMALVALGGAALLTVRRRTTVAPSGSAS
jgi:hypothetical protein